MEAGCGEACSAAFSVITKHSCLCSHLYERWLLPSCPWDSVQDPSMTHAATHCQLWHFFIVQHKVYKRALVWIAHRYVTLNYLTLYRQFSSTLRELSSERSSQSLLIVKLVQLSQLCIFLTENPCTTTLNFWTFYNSMSQKQCIYITTTFPNIVGKNRKQLKPQKILIYLCWFFFFFFGGTLSMNKLISISFYYIRRMFLNTTFH